MSERRVAVYLAGLALFFLIVLLGAFFSRSYLEGNATRATWTTQNERALDDLPLYPGAVETGTPYSTGERDPNATTTTEDGGPFLGYWTTHTYKLPLGVGSDLVLAYYRTQLAGWSAETAQESTCKIAFRRDRAKLDLDACSEQMTLSVNYLEYE